MRRPKEIPQSARSEFRDFFGEKMPGVDRLAMNPVGPLPPDAERTAFIGKPRSHGAASAPQGKQRTIDAPIIDAIRAVVLTVDRRGRAIFFTDCVRVFR